MCYEKVLEELTISKSKHELVDYAEIFKDGYWQEIRFT